MADQTAGCANPSGKPVLQRAAAWSKVEVSRLQLFATLGTIILAVMAVWTFLDDKVPATRWEVAQADKAVVEGFKRERDSIVKEVKGDIKKLSDKIRGMETRVIDMQISATVSQRNAIDGRIFDLERAVRSTPDGDPAKLEIQRRVRIMNAEKSDVQDRVIELRRELERQQNQR